MQDKSKIALFIDADNAPASHIDSILSELASYGVVNIRRAYGNWTNPTLSSWEEKLHDNAIQPIQQFDMTKGKNATDMALVIDVMDTLYTKSVDVICLVSSDCDFMPLATRALADGKTVIGFGERKTPLAFVNSCSKFLYLDKKEKEKASEKEVSPAPAPDTTATEKKTISIKCDTKLMDLLRQTVEAVEDDEGWAKLGLIGSHMANHTSFDPRNYGFKKLGELFQAIDLFEMKKTQGSVFWVQEKKRWK